MARQDLIPDDITVPDDLAAALDQIDWEALEQTIEDLPLEDIDWAAVIDTVQAHVPEAVVVGDGGPMTGGAGNDLMLGTEIGEAVSGGAGHDLAAGLGGADTLSGGTGDDGLAGGAGSDHLDGGAGTDVLHGGADADILIGGAGNDLVMGGTGADLFVFDASDPATAGHDLVLDFDAAIDGLMITSDLAPGELVRNMTPLPNPHVDMVRLDLGNGHVVDVVGVTRSEAVDMLDDWLV